MNFDLNKTIQVLERTPDVLKQLTIGLSEDWLLNNEGGDTWSVFDVLGHLIHGEKTDWIIRARLILSENNDKTFEAFDRFTQMETSKGKSFNQLIKEFKEIRSENIFYLIKFKLTEEDLLKTGIHPALGEVTLKQLLATWMVHDLDHIYQIARIVAKQYKEETGPWIEYLKILKQ